MSDQLIPVTAEWGKRAFVDNAKYLDLYKASGIPPNSKNFTEPSRLAGRTTR